MNDFRDLKPDLLRVRADRITELEAEIERLRAALENVIRQGSLEKAVHAARTALETREAGVSTGGENG